MNSKCQLNQLDLNVVAESELQELQNNYKSNTYLSLHGLIYNTSLKHPRAQNGFVLFRRDLQAFLNSEEASKLKNIGEISKLAADLWNGKPSIIKLWDGIFINEIKSFYSTLSKIAKK
ncbi:23460_t:CDS:1, partial [Racocetra persica]